MSYQTPSLATATSTRVDSACKHIQQCRVSYDHMLDFVDSAQELKRNKMQYCVHKDEMTVGVSRPWKRQRAIKGLGVSAYPRVISNLGDITQPQHANALKMIKYVYHFATSIRKRNEIIDQMDHDGPAPIPNNSGRNPAYFDDGNGHNANLSKLMPKMFDFYPVGVANTLGYAHPESGDTMSSVMIGGLRTIMNGDFEVFAGDLIQWYWTFEVDCFHPDGRRKSIVDANGVVCDGGDPEVDCLNHQPPPRAADPRRLYNDYQYGASALNQPSDKAKHVARIKPYVRDDAQPRLYDWIRVFAVAICSAKPNEMVDIKISRQSM